MTRLNEIVAVEKGIKQRVTAEGSRIHNIAQKADKFIGFQKVYERNNDSSADLPAERKKVEVHADAVIAEMVKAYSELYDVEATKDVGNCSAKADVVVNGTTLIEAAPVTLLLFLEHQCVDLKTFISKLPVLDESEDWELDPATSLWKTEVKKTHRSEKLQEPLVLYPHQPTTPPLAAQTQLITRDVVVGYWAVTKFSGALTVSRKKHLLERIDLLEQAVKQAREQANNIEVERKRIGQAVLGWLFRD